VATDEWWESAAPERRIQQSLRCYTPADLALLLDGTGLSLAGIMVGDTDSPQERAPALLGEEFEYLAILRRTE
ncbi:hypothetical protein ACW9HQ_37840, partial [Nocardia gipuzkoensis]